MNKSVIDTDILSEILKRRDPVVAKKAEEYRREHGKYTVTAVNVAEVVKGLHKILREDLLQSFLAAIRGEEVLSLDSESAVVAGRIFADLELTGKPIGRADPFIRTLRTQRTRGPAPSQVQRGRVHRAYR